MVKRGPRRRRRRSRRKRTFSIGSTLRMANTALLGINTVRSLTMFPKQILKDKNNPEDSWLEKAFPYMAIAMKLFGVTLSGTEHLSVSTAAISSTVQCILFGAEDILYDHPITAVNKIEVNGKEVDAMTIDYSVARVRSIDVIISLMGAVEARAGRIAAYLKPLTREKAYALRGVDGVVDANEKNGEVKTFQQLTQMPGCVVSPNLRPLRLHLKTSGFPASPIEIGMPSRPTKGDVTGGLPLFQLIVGYQDMASNTNDPHTMYSLSEAALCVELSGNISLEQPVATYRILRSKPITLYSTDSVQIVKGMRSYVDVPLKYVIYDKEGLKIDFLTMREDKLPQSLDSMAM